MIVGKGVSADRERWIMGRVGNSAYCEKGIMRGLCKSALRVG